MALPQNILLVSNVSVLIALCRFYPGNVCGTVVSTTPWGKDSPQPMYLLCDQSPPFVCLDHLLLPVSFADALRWEGR